MPMTEQQLLSSIIYDGRVKDDRLFNVSGILWKSEEFALLTVERVEEPILVDLEHGQVLNENYGSFMSTCEIKRHVDGLVRKLADREEELNDTNWEGMDDSKKRTIEDIKFFKEEIALHSSSHDKEKHQTGNEITQKMRDELLLETARVAFAAHAKSGGRFDKVQKFAEIANAFEEAFVKSEKTNVPQLE